MQNSKKFYIVIAILSAILYSCNKESQSLVKKDRNLGETISLKINFLNVEQTIEQSKGALVSNPIQVSDVNIYIFNQLGDLITHSYSTSLTTIKDLIIFSNLKYRVYAIANAGIKLHYKNISDIEQHKHSIGIINEIVDDNGGFLMSGKTDLITLTNNMTLSIPLTRNVAKFVLSCNYTNLNTDVKINVKKVSLKNAPNSVYPFKDNKAENSQVIEGESRDITELSNLSSGVPFYLYENMQGSVAPSALDNKSKEQGMSTEAKANSSYIEMEYEYLSSSKKGEISYRFYLGQTHKDCNIKRNTQYNCTVFFKGDGSVDENSWSVDNSKIIDLVTSLSFNPTNHTFTDLNAQITVLSTILPHTADNKTLAWESSNSNVAKVDANGKVTSIGDGTCAITATTTDGTNISAICNIEVNSKVYVTDVEVNPTELNLFVGENRTLTASVLPSNATVSTIKWTSSNTNIATVDDNGKVTAIANGTCKIRATSTDDPNKYAECNLTVISPVIELDTPITLYDGEEFIIPFIKLIPSTAVPDAISSNTDILEIIETTSSGIKVKALCEGTVQIKATIGKATGTCDITIEKLKLQLGVSSLTAYENFYETIPYSIYPSKASSMAVKFENINSAHNSLLKFDGNRINPLASYATIPVKAYLVDRPDVYQTLDIKINPCLIIIDSEFNSGNLSILSGANYSSSNGIKYYNENNELIYVEKYINLIKAPRAKIIWECNKPGVQIFNNVIKGITANGTGYTITAYVIGENGKMVYQSNKDYIKFYKETIVACSGGGVLLGDDPNSADGGSLWEVEWNYLISPTIPYNANIKINGDDMLYKYKTIEPGARGDTSWERADYATVSDNQGKRIVKYEDIENDWRYFIPIK